MPVLEDEEGQKKEHPPYSPNHWAEFDQIWTDYPLGEYIKDHRGDFWIST